MFRINYLRNFNFSPWTTDEEKIIWAYTRGFPQRIIQTAFHFGSDKVSRTIMNFKQTGTTPSPAQSNPRTKLTQNVLLYKNYKMILNRGFRWQFHYLHLVKDAKCSIFITNHQSTNKCLLLNKNGIVFHFHYQ